MNYTNKKIKAGNRIRKIEMFFGVFMIAFGVFVFAAIIGNMDIIDAGLLLIIIFSSVYLIRDSIATKELIKLANSYYIRLINHPGGLISDLAAGLGESETIVIINLNKLINKGYLEGVFMDNENHCVRFREGVNNPSGTGFAIVTCRSCGAVNKIQKGTVTKCEFCGNEIN